ncbi:fatty acyl-CoA reductase 1 [Ixodes scapularis]
MSGHKLEETTDIAEFFAGKSVFLTGITGFLGKVLLEKMLRSCPDIGNIFVLIREKKGQKGRDRLKQILNEVLFERVQKVHPEALSKVQVVAGDLLQPELGMSNSDRERLTREVSVVIHGAASVRFDEPLRFSVRSNIAATKMILDLCHEMKNLKVYVHVSTAYCNCNEKEIREQVYPTHMKPANLMNIAEWMDDSLLEAITPKLIKDRPNTYTYTKAVAEQLVQEASSTLPVTIIRPSIITGAWKEPLEGWVDNYNGPTGLLIALGKGVLKTVYTDLQMSADLIPVDMVSNNVLAAAWYRGSGRSQKLLVYNMTSGADNPLTWQEFMTHTWEIPYNYPSSIILRYPQPRCTHSKLLHRLRMFFQHYLPAQTFDVALRAVGRKPMLSRLYDKVKNNMDLFEYFTTTEWYFHNDNVRALYSEMSPKDKEEFNFDVKTLDWKEYLFNYCMGIRKYLLKEELDTLPEAQRHLTKLYIVSKAGNMLLMLGAWRFIKAVAFDPVDIVYNMGSYFQEFVDTL